MNIPRQMLHVHPGIAKTETKKQPANDKHKVKSLCNVCSFEYQVQENDAAVIQLLLNPLPFDQLTVAKLDAEEVALYGLSNKSPPLV